MQVNTNTKYQKSGRTGKNCNFHKACVSAGFGFCLWDSEIDVAIACNYPIEGTEMGLALAQTGQQREEISLNRPEGGMSQGR